MKGIVIDTNIAVEVLNGKNETIAKLRSFNPIYLPVIAGGELIFGALNSNKLNENIQRFEAFINDCIILHTTTPIIRIYAEIRKKLKNKGHPIPENDIWIAALCISYDLPLATRDKHFQFIDDLLIIDF
jgi:tRNA(fMet)-specific endonuclease VapC